MKTLYSLLLCYFFLSSFLADNTEPVHDFLESNTASPHPDFIPLVALYNSTNGANWTNNTNWDPTGLSSCDPCQDNWFGITCSNGRVTTINLGQNQLNGTFPTQLEDLTNIESLVLYNNQLQGNIPTEFGNLINLNTLILTQNQLSGNIPVELGSLSNLTSLILTENQLTGSVPIELGNLSNLAYLFLSKNQLTGSIPPVLGNLSNLLGLSLDFNQFNGFIPPELGSLINLLNLSLAGNQLSGTIPPELGNLSNLTSLSLGRNQLTGNIPVELGNLVSLLTIHINHNNLSGSIPVEMANLSNLQLLALQYNQITGSIPSEIGNLSDLKSLDLNNNQIGGSIPYEIGNLSDLQVIRLYNNQLNGPIPKELGVLDNLIILSLHTNQLSGCIPSEFSVFCQNGITVDITNNTGLTEQDFTNFCTSNVGVCPVPSCISDLIIIQNPSIDSIYGIASTITSSSNINSPLNITYKAKTSITLLPDFEVKAGATFLATIENCSSLQESEPIVLERLFKDIKSNSLLSIYPNPFTGSTTINFSLSTASLIQLNLFDVNGKMVHLIVANQIYQEGRHEIKLKRNGLLPGIYFLHLGSSEESIVRKISIVK